MFHREHFDSYYMDTYFQSYQPIVSKSYQKVINCGYANYWVLAMLAVLALKISPI